MEGLNFKICKNLQTTFHNAFRFSQIGVVSYGSECPSHGVYARVTEVKYWIQYIARGAVDSNCNEDIPDHPGKLIICCDVD